MKTNRILKRILIVLIVFLAVIFLILLPAASILTYNSVFGIRYQTSEKDMLYPENFPGLIMEREVFASNEGQKLAGYFYTREGIRPKGVVIMAHGIGGGGHNPYLISANFFTENGYYVFAYDATGNDNSEGNCVGGLPQGVIDLDYAILYVEKSEKFAGLPIFLFGHSWGGFCVTSVLNERPEVKAVCSVSGFNKSMDLINAQGKEMVGSAIYLLLPYLNLYEKMKFGKYSSQTGMDGFKCSDAAVMIVHSADDTTVPIQYGFDIYYEKYSNDDNFFFVKYDNMGHNRILSMDENPRLMEMIVEFYDKYADCEAAEPKTEQAIEAISDMQTLAAIKKYCLDGNPDLKKMIEAGEYPINWEIASSDAKEIVILFRSYTGAQIRYYVDPVSGEVYVTEFVPGITPEEQRTEESFNVKDYLE